jgi:hypothetical protein
VQLLSMFQLLLALYWEQARLVRLLYLLLVCPCSVHARCLPLSGMAA